MLGEDPTATGSFSYRLALKFIHGIAYIEVFRAHSLGLGLRLLFVVFRECWDWKPARLLRLNSSVSLNSCSVQSWLIGRVSHMSLAGGNEKDHWMGDLLPSRAAHEDHDDPELWLRELLEYGRECSKARDLTLFKNKGHCCVIGLSVHE